MEGKPPSPGELHNEYSTHTSAVLAICEYCCYAYRKHRRGVSGIFIVQLAWARRFALHPPPARDQSHSPMHQKKERRRRPSNRAHCRNVAKESYSKKRPCFVRGLLSTCW